MMPPLTIELRRGWDTWLYRSEATAGKWEDTWCTLEADFPTVKRVMARSFPDHAIRWPELEGMQWQDC